MKQERKKDRIALVVILGTLASSCALYILYKLLPVFAFFCVFVLDDSFPESQVRKIEISPDGKYQVEIVSWDEGALGGSTYVYVNEVSKQKKSSVVGEKYKGKSKPIAGARWNDYERMSIVWSDNLHFQIIIEYSFTTTKNVKDVDLSGQVITTSEWREE